MKHVGEDEVRLGPDDLLQVFTEKALDGEGDLARPVLPERRGRQVDCDGTPPRRQFFADGVGHQELVRLGRQARHLGHPMHEPLQYLGIGEKPAALGRRAHQDERHAASRRMKSLGPATDVLLVP